MRYSYSAASRQETEVVLKSDASNATTQVYLPDDIHTQQQEGDASLKVRRILKVRELGRKSDWLASRSHIEQTDQHLLSVDSEEEGRGSHEEEDRS